MILELLKNFVVGLLILVVTVVPIMAIFSIPYVGITILSIIVGGVFLVATGMFGFMIRELITEYYDK